MPNDVNAVLNSLVDLFNTQSSKWFPVVSGIISIMGALLALDIFPILLKRISGSQKSPEIESYSKRLATLTENLSKASTEVDNVLSELAVVALDKEKTVKELEVQLKQLEKDEINLQKRIQDLQSVPVPVAERFAEIIAQKEKNSAKRDYILFGSGVIITTIVSIILNFVHYG